MLYISAVINAIPAFIFLVYSYGILGLAFGYSEKVSQAITVPLAAFTVVGAALAILFTGQNGWLEKLLRLFWFSARKPSNRESERVFPLIQDICQKANIKTPEWFVVTTTELNAYAFGKNTMFLTKKALKDFDDEELKAVIAHELGHLALSHSERSLKRSALQTFTNLCVTPLMRGLSVMRNLCVYLLVIPVIGWLALFFMAFFALAMFAFSMLIFPFAFLDNRILPLFFMKESRENEFQADAFAVKHAGYEAVNKLLEKLDEEGGEAEGNFFETLLHSHPATQYRLDRIDELKDGIFKKAA